MGQDGRVKDKYRVVVIGMSGAGKSTVSTRLADVLGGSVWMELRSLQAGQDSTEVAQA